VVFLRPGGAPLTDPGFPPFQAGGPFSQIADRLRNYNFDVLEKDLSGQYAMQAQMQGMPAAPEPSDEEIKDAVWIVLSVPAGNPQQPPAPLSPKVAEHMKNGGSTLMLFMPNGDNLNDALNDFGISVRTDLIAVHEPIKTASASADFIEEAKKNPLVFISNEFGDSVITKPLRSLDSALVPLVPVVVTPKQGITGSSILPVPTTLGQIWGEKDTEGSMNGETPKFQPEAGDLPGPLFGGALAQNDKGTRVVAIGSVQFIMNQMLNIRDPELAQRGIRASRFPANAELFCNSIFWLAHMEPLIAISPAAMDVNRISPISDGTLKAIRIGLLLIGLPSLVVVCGLCMYFARRD